MVLVEFPGKSGAKMYGITFDLDTHILEDELGIARQKAYAEIEEKLNDIGYKHIQYSVYVCPNPSHSEIQVVTDTVDCLRQLPWFSQAVRQIVAFDISSWGDITNLFAH